MFKFKLVVASVLLTALPCAAFQEPRALPSAIQPAATPRDISALLQPIIEKHKVPGMAAAIVKGWDIEAQGVVGVRKSGSPEKITLQDKFHLGSDTKAMTATLCAMLVEEGKLKWESTLQDVFPTLAASMDAGYRSVTLEQLLTNHGGAPSGLETDGLWGKLWAHKGSPTSARRALLEGVTKHPPEAAPGTKFIYSNAGFAMAGHMAEEVTGSSWEALIQSKLFGPLGITSAGFGAPGSRDTVSQPRGHRESGSAIEPGPGADNPVAIGPAGIVHCTIGDWAKFVALHLRGDQGDARLLKPETFKKLHTSVADDAKYAFGWMVTSRPWAGPGDRVLTHSGSNTMWFCVTWIAPEKDFAVLIACNQGGSKAAKACDEAASVLIREHLKPAGK